MSKVKAIGIMHMNGVSSKTSQPYEMCHIKILVAQVSKTTNMYDRKTVGFEAKELELAPAAYEKFSTLKYPTDLELVENVEMIDGAYRVTVVDFKQ